MAIAPGLPPLASGLLCSQRVEVDDGDRLSRRTPDHGSGGDVELAAVAGAGDHGPGEGPIRERAPAVGARVGERMESAVDAGDRDLALPGNHDSHAAHQSAGEIPAFHATPPDRRAPAPP